MSKQEVERVANRILREKGLPVPPQDFGYLRRDATCRYLGISPRTLSDWQRRRIVPVIKVGRTVLFRKEDLDRALARFTIRAVGELRGGRE